VVDSSPSVANGVVYVGSEDDKFYAITAATGALRWSYSTGAAVNNEAAIANGVIYVGSVDGNEYAFDTYGDLLSAWTGGYAIYMPAVISDGTLTFGSNYGEISHYTLNGVTAAVARSAPTKAQLHPNLALKAVS
jgi:outer membrane protein assembly factor BamB